MDVVTLGSFILDDIYEFPPVRQPLYGVVGGAGTYAAIAARMLLPKERSTRVGLIVHEGLDFPIATKQQIVALEMHAAFIERPGENTTRGSNVYDVDGNRKFEFVTPNVKIYASMMDEEMLASRTYHMICTPARCIDLCKEIIAAREKLLGEKPGLARHLSMSPAIIWEPMEDSCHPDSFKNFLEALNYVDVFSPNQRELLALCSMKTKPGVGFDVQTVRRACAKLLVGNNSRAIVARCGAQGCIVTQTDHLDYLQIPAYHQPHQDPNMTEASRPSEQIVDVTGGGNSFLGGFCAALGSGFQVEGFTRCEAAAFYGNVAASYAIEQFGVPHLTSSVGEELWNGTSPSVRLTELMQRFKNHSGRYCGSPLIVPRDAA